MAQLISVKLSRFDNSPWGFRLQGGKDFGTPLVVQKVNGGSPAEAAGLRAGDAVIKVNNTDTFNLRHKDAQDVIVRAGNNFEVTIQRGGSTWKPSVTPVTANIPTPKPNSPASNISPVTKTSLAAKKQDSPLIGSGHNFSPKPFLNGNGEAPIKSIVNKQYNSPVGIYSEETIAETLSAQAEVLAGGVLGVNFKKNEKNYNAENSEVFKMVQEADKEPRTPEPAEPTIQSGAVTPTNPALAGLTGLRHVSAPETKPQPTTPQTSLPPGQNICADCERLIVHAVGGRATSPRSPTPLGRAMGLTVSPGHQNLNFHQCSSPLGQNQRNHLHRDEGMKPSPDTPVCHNCDKSIVGVFVRIKEKNLHVECFKCSTCGTSLKNVGYYNINNKLYCDIHAKLVARQNPPAAGLLPVTIPPGGKAPAGTISAALANVGGGIPPLAPLSPSLNNHSSPQPFTCNRSNIANVQEGVQRLRLQKNGTSGFASTTPDPRAYENQRQQYSTLNGNVENAKTFTSTLIIQTGNEVGSINNDEKFSCNNTVNRDILYPEKNTENEALPEFELITSKCSEEPTTDLLAISEQPFPARKQAPSTNSIGGPKPFGGAPTAPSLVSTPSLNSGSHTLPRPLSQSATGRYSTLPKPKSSLYRDSYSEEFDYCEERETYIDNPPSPPPPPSVKSKSLIWPPEKPIEEITYPTASPLYINPNPALNQRQESERRQRQLIAQQREREELERQRELSEEQTGMEYNASCSGPSYRKIQLYELTPQRESRSREVTCSRSCSRAESRESLRRSLTPTRINQPIPQPWTATVTTGTNLYHQPCPLVEPSISETVCEQREICEHTEVCQTQQTCERRQVSIVHHHPPRPAYPPICKPVYRSVCPPKPNQEVCPLKAPVPQPEPEPEPEPKPEPVVETEVSFTFRRPSRPNSAASTETINIPSVTVYKDEIDEQREYSTETMERDIGPLHVKKTTIYEKTVEVLDAEDGGRMEVTETAEEVSENEGGTEIESTIQTRGSANLDKEVETISDRKDMAECAEIITAAVNTQQLVEQITEEVTQSKVEERTTAVEQISAAVEQATESTSSNRPRRYSFSEHEKLDCGGFRETHQTVEESELDRYEELTEEIRLDDGCRQQEIENERLKSLREQVQVHQCLREQQIPERRPPPQTLQERRLSAKCSQQDFTCTQKQQVQTEVTCTKKHVQFATESECGIQPLPPTTIKNSTPKQWKSEMVKALTTAPNRTYSPLGTMTTLDAEETVEECRTEQEQSCQEITDTRTVTVCATQDSSSSFQNALTTAPDRPYTPLGFYDQPGQYQSEANACSCPALESNPEPDGYCAPAEILYTDGCTQETMRCDTSRCNKKSVTPQPLPLPTPPPDYHLRDSHLPRSRSETPSRALTMGLKKPGTIPAYQRNLLNPVIKLRSDGQGYESSRTPTPTPGRSKSPAEGSTPEPPAGYIKAQAPKIREDPPPKVKPSPGGRPDKKPQEEGESYTYHEEKNTPQGRLIKDVEGSMRVAYAGDEESFVASEKEIIETLRCPKKIPPPEPVKVCVPVEVERCEVQVQSECQKKSVCITGKVSQTAAKLTCSMSNVSDRFPRTGVCVLPPCPKAIVTGGTQSTKKSAFCGIQSQSCQKTITQSQRSAFCDTQSSSKPGLTVLPCKAPPELGSKAGVVVIPSEESRSCSQPGVYVAPTSDRKGVCVSPCVGMVPATCGQPSGTCGRRSGPGIFEISAKPSSVCVAQCEDGSICVAPCRKPILKSQCPYGRSPSAELPYPQIPLPYDDDNQPTCPLAKSPASETNDLGFQPIHKPRTNLGSQLTQLVNKTNNKPAVQVLKPQAQCSSQNLCQTQTPQCPMLAPNSKTQNLVDPPNLSSHPDLGTGVGGLGGGSKSGSVAGNTAPKRGRGILTQQGGPGSRVPLCGHCNSYVRGPFITALGNIWCPDHFVCTNGQCRRPLQDIGFVEEKGQLYCEYCFEQFLAPPCSKCNNKIKGECLNAIGKHFHPECFNCSYCGKLFGNNPFFLEDGLPYCEADWNELFTTKCFSCGFPVEAGDRWVEALSNNYHSQCFNCTMCKKNLEGQSFYAKGGRPFCKNHAR